MRNPIPINPKKIHGRFTPPSQNTSITADPIDSPPEAIKNTLPKDKAKFLPEKTDTHPIDYPAIWLAVLLTLASGSAATFIPRTISLRGTTAVTAVIQITLAIAALYFNMRNTHLQAKTFPRLGINPLHIITGIDCLLIVFGTIGFATWLIFGAN